MSAAIFCMVMRCFILIVFLVSVTSAYAQQQGAIHSAGANNLTGGVSLNWTIGQLVTSTYKSTDKKTILTQGSQEKIIVTSVSETKEPPVSLVLFPNPVEDILNIRLASPADGDVTLELLDASGRPLLADMIRISADQRQISLRNMSSGVYYLKLKKGNISNVFKVVKL